ncbi:phosphotransferase [Actinorugispora endophytica]|uniref:Phosphotransferase family enzyme n=1 Tax=Actinorugispora endophytica TaxID=1605990 RepID=A0A4R6V6X8_9ACTN|nr:phosphotransferase [Actinorugispora endophytica]TDQ54856.1 phosphotransferase family enzyme [Actinorugispora endophytica]
MSDETAYLTDLAEVLWPCGGLLGRRNRPLRSASKASGTPLGPIREYLPIPSAYNPRVILPATDRYAAVRGIAAFTQRHSFGERLRAALLSTAFASGMAPLLLRDRLRVGSGHTIEHALSEALGRELVIAIHVGPPRANRKPVLLLLTPEGRTAGYAKVGVNALTSRLVAAETDALRLLSGTPLRDVTVPRLLHAGEWNSRPLLVQEALPIGSRTDRPTRRQLLRCVVQVAGLEPITRRPLAASPYLRALAGRVAALGDRPEAGALGAALRRLPDVRMPFGAWHGDLTRWNVASTARRAFLWDWERLAFGVPVGFDALHYELNESVQAGVRQGVRRWLDSGSALLADPVLAATGLRRSAAATVMALYLVDLATRYLHDRQAEAGGRLAAVDDWLLPALADLEERAIREAASN